MTFEEQMRDRQAKFRRWVENEFKRIRSDAEELNKGRRKEPGWPDPMVQWESMEKVAMHMLDHGWMECHGY